MITKRLFSALHIAIKFISMIGITLATALGIIQLDVLVSKYIYDISTYHIISFLFFISWIYFIIRIGVWLFTPYFKNISKDGEQC